MKHMYQAEQFSTVIDLYQGPFMAGSIPADNRGIDLWRDSIEAEVDAMVRRAAEAIIDDAIISHQWRRAQEVAEWYLAHHPYHPSMHAYRIVAIAGISGPRAAVAEVDSHIATLKRAGKPVPNEFIQAIEPHLEEWRDGRKWSFGHDTGGSTLFAGRREELQALHNLWDNTRNGSGNVVLVEGEPGIGKTTLCERFLRLVALRAGKALFAACRVLEKSVSYGVIVDAISQGIDSDDIDQLEPIWSASILHAMPELAREMPKHALPRLGSEGTQRRLFESIVQLVTQLARKQPVVLFVDDIQWIDESSATLLGYLARRTRNTRVMLLCASRRPVLGDSNAGMLTTALRQVGAFTIGLRPWTETEYWHYVDEWERATGLDIRSYRDRVFHYSAGRPFVISGIFDAMRRGEDIFSHSLADVNAGRKSDTSGG